MKLLKIDCKTEISHETSEILQRNLQRFQNQHWPMTFPQISTTSFSKRNRKIFFFLLIHYCFYQTIFENENLIKNFFLFSRKKLFYQRLEKKKFFFSLILSLLWKHLFFSLGLYWTQIWLWMSLLQLSS